jgi:hypothetical protein
MKRVTKIIEMLGRAAAVIICLPLFVVIFYELRKRL